jgi:hypothetical protein
VVRDGVTDALRVGVAQSNCRGVGIPECVDGCVTDGNCGPTERCDRPGDAKVGTCTSCWTPVHEL